jgi:hypothetical protein
MVIAMSVLLMTVGVMLVAQTLQTDPLLQANTIQHSAYRGLEAGMNAYQSIINTNPNLANCNTSTNSSALCQGAQYQKWNLVSNTDGGNGTIPEWYLFGNPQPVFNGDGSLASLQVQVVGVAGFPNHYAFQSSVANLGPVNGFLDNLWWSDFQASDTNVSNPVYTGPNAVCKYNWANNYQGPGPNCGAVFYGPTDVVNGPVFSNDSVYVSPSPTFGLAPPLPAASVKTQDPTCLFVDGSSALTTLTTALTKGAATGTTLRVNPLSSGVSPTDIVVVASGGSSQSFTATATSTTGGTTLTVTSQTANATYPVGASITTCSGASAVSNFAQVLPISAIAQPHQTPPADDSSLKLVASIAGPTNNGCVYYGPTTITLTGSTTAGTMTVTSPDTVATGNGCPLNTNGSLPHNGVVYVDNAVPTSANANSRIVAGVNPFDDTADSGHPYAQTCADDGSGMPCYFGWTGSATQDSEGDAFVSGSLAASATGSGVLTIGASNDIIITGALTYGDCASNWVGTAQQSACNYRTDKAYPNNDSLGLIANQYIEVNHPVYPTNSQFCFFNCHQQGDPLPNCGAGQVAAAPLCNPVDASGNTLTIDAALLGLTQSFGVDNYSSGSALGKLILYGSIQQEARGAVGTFSGSTVVSGYSKLYTWDPRLELVAPPSYLNPGTASYNLNSSAISPSLLCPALKNVYVSPPGTVGTTACPTVPAP